MRRCYTCKTEKPDSEFGGDKNRPSGLNHRCKSCNRQKTLEFSFKKLGITQADYDGMFEKQGGKCAICGKHPERVLAVDHCHKTGAVRGLLCRKCNAGLGNFDDDRVNLSAALDYLKNLC